MVPKEFDFLCDVPLMRITGRLCHARLPGVILPEPLLALSSPQLLVMQRMQGTAVSLFCHHALTGLMAKRYIPRMHFIQLLLAYSSIIVQHMPWCGTLSSFLYSGFVSVRMYFYGRLNQLLIMW